MDALLRPTVVIIDRKPRFAEQLAGRADLQLLQGSFGV